MGVKSKKGSGYFIVVFCSCPRCFSSGLVLFDLLLVVAVIMLSTAAVAALVFCSEADLLAFERVLFLPVGAIRCGQGWSNARRSRVYHARRNAPSVYTRGRVAPLETSGWQQTGSGSQRVPDPVCERTEMGSGTGTARSQTPFPQSPDVSNGATGDAVSSITRRWWSPPTPSSNSKFKMQNPKWPLSWLRPF